MIGHLWFDKMNIVFSLARKLYLRRSCSAGRLTVQHQEKRSRELIELIEGRAASAVYVHELVRVS